MPSNFELQLEAKPNIQKCIICQNINDKKGDKHLTSTENGCHTVFQICKR